MDKEERKNINTLLLKIAQGDFDAVGEIYDRIGTNLFYVAYKYTRNPETAKDVLHSVFSDIYETARKFKYSFNGYGYLCKIIKNQALSLCRRPYDEDIEFFEEYLKDSVDIEEDIEKKEEYSIILKAICSLDEKDKNLIKMAYYENMTVRQIAEKLDIPKSNVGRAIKDAREKVKRFIT